MDGCSPSVDKSVDATCVADDGKPRLPQSDERDRQPRREQRLRPAGTPAASSSSVSVIRSAVTSGVRE